MNYKSSYNEGVSDKLSGKDRKSALDFQYDLNPYKDDREYMRERNWKIHQWSLGYDGKPYDDFWG